MSDALNSLLPVSALVESYEFSAHADSRGLRELLSECQECRILVTHGDRCEAFAEQLIESGYAASAPESGDEITA